MSGSLLYIGNYYCNSTILKTTARNLIRERKKEEPKYDMQQSEKSQYQRRSRFEHFILGYILIKKNKLADVCVQECYWNVNSLLQ